MTFSSFSSGRVKAALCRRYPLDKGWVTATEVANNRANRYADHVSIYCWPSPCVVGHEIKVTRSDYLRELEDPTKREWMEKTCHRRWFVAPKGMILPAEIPQGWGLMEILGKPDDPKLRQKIAAPIAEIECDVPVWFGRILWKAHEAKAKLKERNGKLLTKAHDEDVKKREEEIAKKWAEVYEKEGQVEREQRELESVWRELCQAAGLRLHYRQTSPRLPVCELAHKMRVHAAKQVVLDAKQAKSHCESLVEAAEEALKEVEEEIEL